MGFFGQDILASVKNKSGGGNKNFIPDADPNSGNFFGGNADFIKGNLKDTINSDGMNQFLRDLLQSGRKDIQRSSGNAQEDVRESRFSEGFGGTNANIFSDIFAEESSQTSQLKTGIAGIASQNEQNALGQLIGVNSQEAQLQELARQFDVTTEEGRRQFEKEFGLKERELDAMLDAQGGDFLSVLGNVLGIGAGIATGGIFSGVASGLGSLFEGFFSEDA